MERGERMPRTARMKSSTDFYHVIARGINHERIFNQPREKNNFIRILKKYLKKYDVELYAYVIMSTHFHLLIHSELEVLSGYLAIVLAEFAEYYNYKHNRNGHVFQNRFKSECVENMQYFWNCIRYIHMNPVNANLVKNPMKYKYSSIKEYEVEKEQIIHPKAISLYKETFSDFDEYLNFHDKNYKEIFLDTPEEIELQQQKIAMVILIQESHRLGVQSPKEVIERQELRDEYKRKVQSNLQVSKRKTERLYRNVKRCIIGK